MTGLMSSALSLPGMPNEEGRRLNDWANDWAVAPPLQLRSCVNALFVRTGCKPTAGQPQPVQRGLAACTATTSTAKAAPCGKPSNNKSVLAGGRARS